MTSVGAHGSTERAHGQTLVGTEEAQLLAVVLTAVRQQVSGRLHQRVHPQRLPLLMGLGVSRAQRRIARHAAPNRHRHALDAVVARQSRTLA